MAERTIAQKKPEWAVVYRNAHTYGPARFRGELGSPDAGMTETGSFKPESFLEITEGPLFDPPHSGRCRAAAGNGVKKRPFLSVHA